MQVAKITLFNGDVYYTNDCGWNRLKLFFDNVRERYGAAAPIDARNRVDMIEMSQEEYAAIPATSESAALFDSKAATVAQPSTAAPIDMLLFCPRCHLQHVDEAEPESGWTNPPHATHACKGCGLNWRPSNVPTNGVGSLPAAEAKHVERMKASDPLLWRKP